MKQVYDLALWISFLTHLGLVRISQEASHTKWDYPPDSEDGQLIRPIIVRENEKQVPIFHIHTSLKSIGLGKSAFENWLKSQHKGKSKSTVNVKREKKVEVATPEKKQPVSKKRE